MSTILVAELLSTNYKRLDQPFNELHRITDILQLFYKSIKRPTRIHVPRHVIALNPFGLPLFHWPAPKLATLVLPNWDAALLLAISMFLNLRFYSGLFSKYYILIASI